MKRRQTILTLSVVGLLAIIAGTSRATIITFADAPAPANNKDLAPNYGSNVGVASAAFANGGEGMTPNIALTWSPTGGPENVNDLNADVLEYHSAGTFTNAAGPAFTAPVLQLDVDASNHPAGFVPVRPKVDFVPDPGWAVRIHGFKIGNATDQTETPHPWTARILTLPGLTEVASYTTASLSAGNSEIVALNYTGALNQSLRLELSDGISTATADHHPRSAIDDLRFGQVVPEPASLLLVALAGLLLTVTRRR